MVDNNPHLSSVDNMSQISEVRLWKTLDKITDRLVGIESQLSELVRLEERVKSHDHTLSRYGDRLDVHDNRIRETELQQANQGDRSSVERLISNVQNELTDVKKELSDFKTKDTRNEGQKDIGKEVLKYLLAFVSAALLYKVTRG